MGSQTLTCDNMTFLTAEHAEELWEESCGFLRLLGTGTGSTGAYLYSQGKNPVVKEGFIYSRGERWIINEVEYGRGDSKWILITRRRHLRGLKIGWILRKEVNQS